MIDPSPLRARSLAGDPTLPASAYWLGLRDGRPLFVLNGEAYAWLGNGFALDDLPGACMDLLALQRHRMGWDRHQAARAWGISFRAYEGWEGLRRFPVKRVPDLLRAVAVSRPGEAGGRVASLP
jgi:hypothetical protein